MCWTFEICGAGIFNRFLWASNDKAVDQSGSFITSLSSHIQDSKMAAAPGSTFLAHFKDCILLRSHNWIVFWDLWRLTHAKVRNLRILIVKLLSGCVNIKTYAINAELNRYDHVNYQGKVKLIILWQMIFCVLWLILAQTKHNIPSRNWNSKCAYLKVWIFWRVLWRVVNIAILFFGGCFVFVQTSRDTWCEKTPKQFSDLHLDNHS